MGGWQVARAWLRAQSAPMITHLTSHTGAEVVGVDLTAPVDDALRDRLNRAFVKHSVLVFRDQHLSPHQLLSAVQLCQRFTLLHADDSFSADRV
jgi:alpha-ketoglutarate-dependent taurine dioxygenase